MRLPVRPLAVLVAAVLVFGPSASASAETTTQGPTLRVTVTGPAGAPLEGVDRLDVRVVPSPTRDVYHEYRIAPGESLEAEDLHGGDVHVSVSPRGGRYVGERTEVFRVAATGTTEITVELEAVSLVAGAVRVPSRSGPAVLRTGAVELHRQRSDGSWEHIASNDVGAAGRYGIAVDQDGTYRLDYASQDNAYWARVGPLQLSRSQDATADIAAMRSAAVTGTISIRGRPLSDRVLVNAYELVGGAWESTDFTYTASGRYALHLPGEAGRRLRLGFQLHGEQDEVFWDGSGLGATRIEDARTIAVRAGERRRGTDITLRPSVAAAEAITTATPPVVSGRAIVGRTLTSTPGEWSVPHVDVTYRWRRSGIDIPGATAATYTLTSQDVGHPITVAVVASKPDYAASSAVVSTPVGPVTAPADLVRSTLLPVVAPGRGKVAFAGLVWAAGVPLPKVDGILTVRLGGRRLASVPVRNGLAKVEVKGQPKGARAYTLEYGGNALVQPASRTVPVTIR